MQGGPNPVNVFVLQHLATSPLSTLGEETGRYTLNQRKPTPYWRGLPPLRDVEFRSCHSLQRRQYPHIALERHGPHTTQSCRQQLKRSRARGALARHCHEEREDELGWLDGPERHATTP